MRKTIIAAILLGLVLAVTVSAKYPSSGKSVPDGSAILKGDLIGEEIGWDGSARTGNAAAFDGNTDTYYDPTAASQDYTYCGLDLGTKYILTKVCIMPRDNWTDRYYGASIQGSNDMENWYTLYESDHVASSRTWQVITDFESNIGFRYYRYWNGQTHGDVAEVELYGYAGTLGNDPYDTAIPLELGEVAVTFNTGLDEAYETAAAKTGETYNNLPTPTRDGYVFGGWFTRRSGGTKIEDGSPVTRMQNHTLYAHWLTGDAAEVSAEPEKTIEIQPETSEVPAEKQVSEKNEFRVIPVICIAVSVLAVFAAGFITIRKSK